MMTFVPQHERELFQVMKDRRQVSQSAIADYLDRTGLTAVEFAQLIGWSNRSFQAFLADKHQNVSRRDWNIIQAAQEYISAHPVTPAQPASGDLFETANVKLIRDTFAKLLLRTRAFMLYAPPGSQKTFVLQHEIYALNAREIAKGRNGARAYYVRAREGIAPGDMLKRIALACGTRSTGTIDRIIAALRQEHTGRQSLLVIDEAQLLSLACFEVIRELLDSELFSLLIAGSHDLFLKFARSSATLEQWNSRIAQKVRLPGVAREEARAIVQREVGYILGQSHRAQEAADKLIDRATVVDAYVPVAEGQPKATYINIRTLCNALDDLRMQFADRQAQKESAA